MSDNNKDVNDSLKNKAQPMVDVASSLTNVDALSQYLKSTAGTREGRAIPPLEKWHPKEIADMDLTIKANGEWWHEGGHMTRESLVSLFATILWKEDNNGAAEYFLKTPVQKIRIQVEDAPLLINDVGIVKENDISWLEFTTTTGDVVRLDDEHPITLKAYQPEHHDETENISASEGIQDTATEAQVRPYMPVRNGLSALIGRNTFYHLAEIGELTEDNGTTILTLQSGGQSYTLSMPAH
ncbi:DUF1285 domain-containing protein [Psychrobacter sp. NG27]|uniref:DUF1285 domain-containing protein n=1 Tax=Psychrobacter sp. NG27 TaxID=2781966 RepID=UPI0018DF0BE2|nr:DUF1285 domain-containing protein [Psychrobacter sp. NG27]MBI0427317.1 DUF1285 domain-containing protein [Psychrobacter sp. NG27]